MLLLDSLYINNSGGKTLLDYLVQELEASNVDAYYLFDKRCEADYGYVPATRKQFMEASLFQRHRFYLKNNTRFTKVFCFGNLAPTVKLRVPVYTYLHQRLFIEKQKHASVIQNVTFTIKSFIFGFLTKHTDMMMVQTESMRRQLQFAVPALNPDRIVVLPFYEQLNYPHMQKVKDSFIYVSNGSTHKNHASLIEAFTAFYDEYKTGTLILTIDTGFPDLYEWISQLQKENYPIVNLGFVPKEQLGKHYATAEFSIYPSISESFGLGILEAIEGGCKIIGADLDYMYSVCDPSLAFNPKGVDSIKRALATAVSTPLEDTKARSGNRINDLLKILK